MAKKYTKQDEKMIKDLMNTLYDQHKLSGGSFFLQILCMDLHFHLNNLDIY